jgi:hypothetical protein
MRGCMSEEEFAKRCSRVEFTERLVKPFINLQRFAEMRYPGHSEENLAYQKQLIQKLHTELQSLRIFIFSTNEILRRKVETIQLKIEFNRFQLVYLMGENEISDVLKKAASIINAIAETGSEKHAIVKDLQRFAGELPAEWKGIFARNIRKLFEEIVACDAAVRVAQDRYFDGYPILFVDLEVELKHVIANARDLVSEFNPDIESGDGTCTEQGCGVIDIDKIMRDAIEDANMEILRKPWEDEAYRRYLEMTKGVTPKSQT